MYSVKYLGIVDGDMGILSRKAVMQGPEVLPVNKETSSLVKEVD